MRLKIFTFFFLIALLVCLKPGARANTRVPVMFTGHLSNTAGQPVKIGISSFDRIMATDFRIGDSITFILTDADGNFSAQLYVPEISAATRIYAFFDNCKNERKDTSIIVNDSLLRWNTEYCPPCPASFNVNYCPCPDDFFLEFDTTLIKLNSIVWDFGDGTISTDLLPTHYYLNKNLYQVCATITDPHARSIICSYCQYLGFDSTNHVVSRNESEGFTLNVIQKGTLGLLQNVPSNSFEIAPNPVTDNANIQIYSDNENNYSIKIFNSIGQLVKVINQSVTAGYSTFFFNVGNLERGIYFMSITFGDKQMNRKFMK